MKKIKNSTRATPSLTVRWNRLQQRLTRLYVRRVMRPVSRWHGQGATLSRVPQLPWWEPFLQLWLRWSGRFSQSQLRHIRRWARQQRRWEREQ
jgi:hypothetical protein